MIEFIVYGEPFGKQRHRYFKAGGKVKTYTPKETVSYEEHVRMSYLNTVGSEKRIGNGIIKATINAFYSVPKSVSKKKKALMIGGQIRPGKKPDCDNIAKAVLDALNKIAYDDDKQIVELVVNKWYSLTPRVEVELWRIGDE